MSESAKCTRRETLIAGAALTVMLPSAAGAAGANDLRSDVDVRLRVNGAMHDPMLDSRATLLDMLR